jgi:hypothetical protein
MSRNNNSPRSKFLEKFDDHRLAAVVWDLMELATTHDPDHAKELRNLHSRLELAERRLDRIGAPQYRRIK